MFFKTTLRRATKAIASLVVTNFRQAPHYPCCYPTGSSTSLFHAVNNNNFLVEEKSYSAAWYNVSTNMLPQETQELVNKASNLQIQIQHYKEDFHDHLHFHTIMYQKLKAMWTYHSNAIEGSRLSLDDTIFFLQEGLTASGCKPLKDYLDAQNHAESIDYMYNLVNSNNQQPPAVSLHTIKSTNALLLNGISSTPAFNPLNGEYVRKPLIAGEFKRNPNSVLQRDGKMHEYVQPIQVEPQMQTLIQWIHNHINSNDLHPVVIAAVAHYNMVRIHPFDDGNGRGSRLLMNLLLLQKRFLPAIVRVDDRNEYFDALRKADNGDMNSFIAFIANSICWTQQQFLSDYMEYGNNLR